MCTNPLLIRNRKYKHISVDLPNSYIKVPCGKCDECLQKRASSLYVRARMEFDACIKAGGCGFMCCLTYSDDLLPTILIDGQPEMVFDKQAVIKFIKRLRTNLERKYQRQFKVSAPAFKYLVTSEYGTDEEHTHRPHYHLLFFFMSFVSFTLFRQAFIESTYKRRGKRFERYFGYILQCEPLDPQRGGIKYSGKYVLKDLMFEKQREFIENQIKFKRDYVDNLYHIIKTPLSVEEEFKNKCIRQTKAYKKSVRELVSPYRSMLQFYLISNDLGVSHIVSKYGESLANMPFINFEGFPFSLPKLVKDRLQQNYGYKKSNELSRTIFVNYIDKMFKELTNEGVCSSSVASDLVAFARSYIQPRNGSLYLYNPVGIDLEEYLLNSSSLVPWDKFIDDMRFFYDNDFYEMRYTLLCFMEIYDSEERRLFRASLARQRAEKSKEKYEQKKKNKYGI